MPIQEGESDKFAGPIEVVGQWLQNLLDPDVVNSMAVTGGAGSAARTLARQEWN